MNGRNLVGVAALAAAVAAPAAIHAQETSIYACADNRGRLRIVAEATECNDRETLVSWNAAGLPGSAGIRVLDSSLAPQQVGHWLGVMDGYARVGFHAVLPTGDVLNMALPVAPSGFIHRGELFFPVDASLVAAAVRSCLTQPEPEACMMAAFEQHLRNGEICQGAPYLPARAPDPLSPTAFFATTAILGSAAELYRADIDAAPMSVAIILPGSSARLVFVYDPDPVDPILRCVPEIRTDAPSEAYPTTLVLSLYSVFAAPFSIRIDGTGGS